MQLLLKEKIQIQQHYVTRCLEKFGWTKFVVPVH